MQPSAPAVLLKFRGTLLSTVLRKLSLLHKSVYCAPMPCLTKIHPLIGDLRDISATPVMIIHPKRLNNPDSDNRRFDMGENMQCVAGVTSSNK